MLILDLLGRFIRQPLLVLDPLVNDQLDLFHLPTAQLHLLDLLDQELLD
jgi:hypothetical protein